MSMAGLQTGAARPPLPVGILAWRPVRSGSLRGFASVGVGALVLHDIAVFTADDKAWMAMPSKLRLSGNNVVLDDTGKPRRSPVAEWRDGETARRFFHATIAALLTKYPRCAGSRQSRVTKPRHRAMVPPGDAP